MMPAVILERKHFLVYMGQQRLHAQSMAVWKSVSTCEEVAYACIIGLQSS